MSIYGLKLHEPQFYVGCFLYMYRGAEVARARAAQLRLQRGIWTSSNFGDLRRALAGEVKGAGMRNLDKRVNLVNL